MNLIGAMMDWKGFQTHNKQQTSFNIQLNQTNHEEVGGVASKQTYRAPKEANPIVDIYHTILESWQKGSNLTN